MPGNQATVVIPTLTAGDRLGECLNALRRQTRRDFETIVVDNSGRGLSRGCGADRVIENRRNEGFGAAVNAGIRDSATPYIAVLNDDAAPHAEWLGALLAAIERRPDAGMCASQVRFHGEDMLDSCGMLVCRDGSSKQRGHLRPPGDFPVEEEVLLPSGSAALYRRAMLEDIGLFDESFFLYCEDTDLGLRARWRGWKCLYVPEAVVEHRYSHSAGRASPVKAYYVERNRLFVLLKNYPARAVAAAPFVSLARYCWHAAYLLGGRGSAARFREGNAGALLPLYVAKAHLAVLAACARLWRERRAIRRTARVTPAVYRRLLCSHRIAARRVAEL